MATTALIVPGGAQARSDARQRAAHASGGLIKIYQYTTGVIGTATTTSVNLAPVDGWYWNQVAIQQLKVQASTSTDFDILMYPTDGFVNNRHWYKNENNNLVMNDQPIQPLFYTDDDLTQELHLQVINTDATNQSTFFIEVVLSPLV